MTPSELPTKPPSGLSVFEAEVFRHLTDHVSAEAEFIAAYRERAESPETPEAARYLIRLVVEDEERHHRVLHEIVSALGDGIAWRHDPDAVPNLPYGAPDQALAEATGRFLAAERADRKELRALRKELRPFRDTSLWALLVEVMEYDTAKHIRILTFIDDHIARPPRR
ncbi:MAG: hypothetical protein ACYCUG_17335 [Acidimicrobiales bacterium]